MDVEPHQYLFVFVALLTSSLVQSTTGFAAGLVAIPILLAAGLELPTAVATVMISAAVQNSIGVYKLRSAIDWRQARLPALLRLCSLPVGAASMYAISSSVEGYREVVRQGFGVLILVVLLAQRVLRVEPAPRQPAYWLWLSFLGSGFLQGFVGLPGPPMVLWLMAHDWSPDRSRGFLFCMFLIGLPFHLLLLWWLWPSQLALALFFALIALPATACGTAIGLLIGKRLNRQVLRRLTVLLLVIIALNSLVLPWLNR